MFQIVDLATPEDFCCLCHRLLLIMASLACTDISLGITFLNKTEKPQNANSGLWINFGYYVSFICHEIMRGQASPGHETAGQSTFWSKAESLHITFTLIGWFKAIMMYSFKTTNAKPKQKQYQTRWKIHVHVEFIEHRVKHRIKNPVTCWYGISEPPCVILMSTSSWLVPSVQRSWQAQIATPPSFNLPQYLPITIITICTFYA